MAHISAIAAAAAVAAAAAPAAAACTPARPGPSVASLTEPWRRALDALLQASAAEGQAWSCTGGVIDLAPREGGATLTVLDAGGRSVSREVASPDEVMPLGEALLAKPMPRAPAASSSAPPATRPDSAPQVADKGSDSTEKPPSAGEKLPPPRALVSALISPRYVGGTNAVWGGITAAGAVPFGPWTAGAWVRYDGLTASLEPHTSPIQDFCIGASAGRSFALGPVELRTSALASAALITRPNSHAGDEDETHLSARFGVEARGVLPLSPLFRVVVAIDGELAPAELDAGRHSMEPMGMDMDRRAALPAYTLGLGVGVELALR